MHARSSICPLTVAILLGLAGCAERKAPDPPPAEDGGPANRADPGRDLAGTGSRLTAGRWENATIDGMSAIEFRNAGQPSIFSMHCDQRGGIVLRRYGSLATGGLRMMEVRVATQTRQLAINEMKADRPVLQAIIPYNDELLTDLKDLQAPLRIDAGDAEPLMLQADPVIGGLVRTCEKGD